MKRIIIDLDNTITIKSEKKSYINSKPNNDVVKKISEYRQKGFQIIIYTSRNMRTFKGNIGKMNIHTLPIIIDWLNKNNVEYDEIILGKPWCGEDGFYVDDRAIRPDEFISNTYEEIVEIINS
jgi:capsule biosynthesis phosphatase